MSDIEAILASRTTRSTSRTFVFDGELLGELERVRAMRDQARRLEKLQPQGLGSEAEQLEIEYRELVEQATEAAVVFKAQAVDSDWLDDLKRRHPPSDEQLSRYREEVKQNPLFARVPSINPDTAGPELLAQAIIDPVMTVDQAKRLWQTNKGQRNELWNLAWNVQEEGSELPFSSAATAPTTGGGEKSSTPANTESPSPS